MRHLRAYKWNDILDEDVPKTLISLEMINKENERKAKEMEKAKRKGRRR